MWGVSVCVNVCGCVKCMCEFVGQGVFVSVWVCVNVGGVSVSVHVCECEWVGWWVGVTVCKRLCVSVIVRICGLEDPGD